MEKTLVEEQFGRSARHYAECEVHASGASLARLVERIAPQPTWKAIDIATGAGHTALAIAPHVSEVIATDITAEMLAQTLELAEARSLKNVSAERASADELPYQDDSLDLVTCRLAAHHFPNIGAFIAESARVLKPGGTLAVVDNIIPDTASCPDLTSQDLEKLGTEYNNFEKLRDPSHARAWSTEEWLAGFKTAGLTSDPVEVLTKEMAFTPWVERMHCAPDTVKTLRDRLLCDGNLKTFLMPRVHNSDVWFSLREAIFVAHAP
ncbi:MAG: methyltransferase domain-containing protein [Pseudomonadota bacterium]